MAKPRNAFERMAQEGAARIDKVRAEGRQLALLPDEPGQTAVEAGTGKPGRPKGAMGKGSSQLREWMASRGYRMPEEQLVRIAALDLEDGPMVAAMGMAEQVLAWSWDGAGAGQVPSPEQRLAVFLQCYAQIQRATEALLPYGTPKASSDVNVQQAVTFVMPGAQGQSPADQARDVTPADDEVLPADVRWQMQQNQQVSDDADEVSDDWSSDG